MKKIYLYLAMLAGVAVACDKSESDFPQSYQESASEVKDVEMIVETISGSGDATTRATIADADASFAWTSGDNIAVHVSSNTASKYVFTTDTDHGAAGATVTTNASVATFKVAYESNYARDGFAVFPSSIISNCETAEANYGQSGHSLDVTLPSSYTLAQVSGTDGTTSPCPMIATNDPESYNWTFYQLCSLLRLTVNAIPPSTNHLKIDFDGKKVCGDFSIANPGTSVIETSDVTDTTDIITITPDGNAETLNNNAWLDGQVLNIPLPTGTYTNITVTAYNKDGDVILTRTRPFAYTATLAKGVKKTASFPVFSINGNKNNSTFASQTRRVVFAPGNLQATTTDNGANWTWGFATHQYDYIGSNAGANNKINGTGTVSENGTVDLFGRSTASNSYGISNSKEKAVYNGAFQDWGKIRTFSYKGTTTTYPEDYWFTLLGHNDNENVNSQWSRIMNYRETGTTVNNVTNARYALAIINTDGTPVNGIILFPDHYDGGTPNGVTWGMINAYNNVTDWGGTRCTIAGWEALEAEGCVFLPAAYRRNTSSDDDIYNYNFYAVNNLNSDWSWYPLRFRSSSGYSIYWNGAQWVYIGCAVRLVHEVK